MGYYIEKKYNISQRELTSILDFGKMTINRYERGGVPTKSQSDYIKLLIENNENNEVFSAKILKTLEKYKDDTTSTIARIIGKHCNRESLNNVKKKRNKTKNNIKPITKRRHNNKNANRTKNMFNSRQL